MEKENLLIRGTSVICILKAIQILRVFIKNEAICVEEGCSAFFEINKNALPYLGLLESSFPEIYPNAGNHSISEKDIPKIIEILKDNLQLTEDAVVLLSK